MTGDRGASTNVGYIMTLAISTLLVTGLVVAGSDFVTTQREQVIREELRVIGQQVSSQLEQADRLVRSSFGSNPTTLRTNRSLPVRAAGKQYDIELQDTPHEQVRLTTEDPDVEVEVNVTLRSAFTAGSRVEGGIVVVEYNTTSSQLELVDD